ncbi:MULTISPECIES: hypothetical protein [unclassified Streptomyces]|uniref:hypothetical protein n=1 Tax=unclassified Streptomyces TaxID=2593676 RepID=UPI00146D182E|nr:hypothetical protein [Streptomyces sp. GMY02]NMO36323.1 hypothetical protein [Streptomyces sp. GMY02]
MAEPTREHRVQNIPWSDGEEYAYRLLVEHTGGTETAPPCRRCNSPERDCLEGKSLRRLLRDATRARTGRITSKATR